MSITPNGHAAMHNRQPLHTSAWITTVSNSVRMMAPVGHTSRQGRRGPGLAPPAIFTQRAPLRAPVDAVLAHVPHHQPAWVLAVLAELLDELHVTPVDAVEPLRIVVAVPRQHATPAVRGRQLVPLLARDLARLAADAHRGVGEEPHRLVTHAFSTLHTNAL